MSEAEVPIIPTSLDDFKKSSNINKNVDTIAEKDRLTFVVNSDEITSIIPPNKVDDVEAPPEEEVKMKLCTKITEEQRDVDIVEERIIYNPVKRIIKRPVEKIKNVEKHVIKEVVRFNDVQTDEVVDLLVPYDVTETEYVPQFVDSLQRCTIAQVYKPHVKKQGIAIKECKIYEPNIKIVNVHIPKIVDGTIMCEGTSISHKKVVGISKAQWNTLVLKMNPALCETGDLDLLPVHRGPDGSVIAYKVDEPVGRTI